LAGGGGVAVVAPEVGTLEELGNAGCDAVALLVCVAGPEADEVDGAVGFGDGEGGGVVGCVDGAPDEVAHTS
jgi:hypothetical protein